MAKKNKNTNKESKLKATTSTIADSAAATSTAKQASNDDGMLYGKKNYALMFAGVGLIFLGYLLMAGGHQPSDQWVDSEIYSTRRTLLAPIVILAGLGMQIFAIFSKK